MVKPIIVRTVHLGVVTWSQSGHLVPVDGVVPDKKKALLLYKIVFLLNCQLLIKSNIVDN